MALASCGAGKQAHQYFQRFGAGRGPARLDGGGLNHGPNIDRFPVHRDMEKKSKMNFFEIFRWEIECALGIRRRIPELDGVTGKGSNFATDMGEFPAGSLW